ncbi:MAG: NGG1p interacting factor NIF3 [Candidatus Omnitrophica bacterium CG1_02_44_16]|nr:MAG: NGG1p interacting factor NIF3 [Candidatus Omnitrophica bacterium CG1_02_44_16]PIY83172.1 MAG: NGG1p interacting factor NIF3 [Candidatus Omnitrophica bacterium CG_4_10_14_0_8_um_filter_44_12]PIZ84020.1 MAG: NGG1p interacting factor NIF3 [Candidatus Omnitrophica bacterium CG_4_10_14_0_2_um_filter_44_9]
MKLKKIYEEIIREGIAADPRDKRLIQEYLQKQKERYQALSSQEKINFDKETLSNPYADSRLLNGDPGIDIKTAIVGIDIDSSELLFINARNNENKKQKIDLAISHHPQGIAYASFHDVMDMQADIFHNMGVPINIAEGLVDERKKEVERRIHASNHHRVTDMAKLLNIPFMCAHTPADNHVVSFLNKTFEAKKPQRLEDIMNILDSFEEYKISKREHVSPNILFGKPSDRAGKLFVDMTGGTEGPKDIVDNLLQAGVGTLVGMHLSEEHYKKFQGKHINVIIAGHIASDNLGLNLLLDKIEKTAKIKILSFSGFRRIKR